MLSTGHINAAQTLIRECFPRIGGLFCPSFGNNLEFPAAQEEKWMQIVHDGENHWLLAARGFLDEKDDSVSIYDSLEFQNKGSMPLLVFQEYCEQKRKV